MVFHFEAFNVAMFFATFLIYLFIYKDGKIRKYIMH